MQEVREQHMTTATQATLPVPTRNLETAKSNLDESGYCLLANALSPNQVSELRIRLVEQAEAEKQKGFAYEDGGKDQDWGAFRDADGRIRSEAFTAESGGINQRLWMLVNKGKVFHQVLFNKGARNLVTHVLGDDYLLSSYTANIAKPGGVKMDLHTDQWWMPPPSHRNKPRVPVGSISRSDDGVDDPDLPMVAPAAAVNVLWMLVDFTPENGGTRVVPGSHLSGHNPTKDGEKEAIDIIRAALETRGRAFGKTLKKYAPRDFRGLCDAFAYVPDGGKMFEPQEVRCDADGLELKMRKCPLKEAWQSAGVTDRDLGLLLHCASAMDVGTMDEAGFQLDIRTWEPGEEGCCSL